MAVLQTGRIPMGFFHGNSHGVFKTGFVSNLCKFFVFFPIGIYLIHPHFGVGFITCFVCYCVFHLVSLKMGFSNFEDVSHWGCWEDFHQLVESHISS